MWTVGIFQLAVQFRTQVTIKHALAIVVGFWKGENRYPPCMGILYSVHFIDFHVMQVITICYVNRLFCFVTYRSLIEEHTLKAY
jgi:hypothetical protein